MDTKMENKEASERAIRFFNDRFRLSMRSWQRITTAGFGMAHA